MAYNITTSNGVRLVTLLDGEVDTSSTDLILLGKNYLGYGEIIADNFVHLLENFSQAGDGPQSPLPGQLWWDLGKTDTHGNVLRGGGVLRVNVDGGTDITSWKNVGLLAGDGTGLEEAIIKDTSGNDHTAIKILINGTLVAILSVDDDYTPAADENLLAFVGGTPGTPDSSDGDYNNTGTIGRGLNLNSSQDFKIRGVAVEAEFADVAEVYVGDASYEPGTVVALGGSAEVTQTTSYADTNVFGIVSTRPAYLMNAKRKKDKNALPIAVAGRIPVKVTGEVKRGDRLIASDIPGVAQAATEDAPAWSIIGRSLSNFAGPGLGTVEATVGAR